MMIKTNLMLIILLGLMILSPLFSVDVYQIREEVQLRKAWLEMDPKLEDFPDAQISLQQLEQRKQEIRAEIMALLSNSQEAYRTDDVRILGYLPERGALSLDNLDLVQHLYISMSAQQADAVTRNPNSFYLTAVRVLNWDLQWEYTSWVLKGSSASYAQQPEPVYNIPRLKKLEVDNDPRVEITEVLMAGDQAASAAYQSYLDGDYQTSLSGFNRIAESSSSVYPVYYYWIGRNHLALGNSAEASYWLKLYLDSGDPNYAYEARELLDILSRQYHIFRSVDRTELPAGLSSTEGESHYVFNPADGYLYFSSARPAAFNGSNIWRAEMINNSWAAPRLVSELCSNADEAVGSFSNDGKTAWLMGKYDSGRRDFDILSSSLKDDKWQSPVLIRQLSSDWDDVDPWIHNDRVMFFSSSRPGGYGGFDIWFSELIDSVWQIPVNLGPAVNTAGNEDSPFLDYDGKTLFFSSDGYPGMGGYDIYKTVSLQRGWQGWSLPENLGARINSPERERRFIHLRGSNNAIRVSERGGVPYADYMLVEYAPRSYWTADEHGYTVWQPDGDKTSPLTGSVSVESLAKPRYYKITSTITDPAGRLLKPELNISYHLADIRYRQTAQPNELGIYEVDLPRADIYRIDCSLSGYSLHSEEIKPGAEESRHLDIMLQPLELDKVFVFNNILFDYNSAVIKAESSPVLNDIAITLLNNPAIRMEISGHTCNTGSSSYNEKLSKQRADSVVKFLLEKGVDADRLTGVGYGLTKPITDNSTEALKEKNRRVELKVIK